MALQDILSGAVSLARSGIVPSLSADVVAITGSGFSPLFASARPMAASVYEFADLMEHPLESGSVIADHIVFKPTEIEMPLICSGVAQSRSTYAALRTAFLTGALLTIVTKTGSYPNMVISDFPHDETPDIFDGIAIRIRFREARFVTPSSELSSSQVANQNQTSTVNRGAQQTSATRTSAASKTTSAASSSGAGAAPQGSTLYQWVYGS